MSLSSNQRRNTCAMLAMIVVLAGCAAAPALPRAELEQQVAAHERAFAQSMADRNFDAFQSFIAPDAIFFTGPTPLRGKDQVVAGWNRFYERPAAPFAWSPDTVEVLDSGTLALSTGPVRDPGGKVVATYTSIWRQDSPGVWRVIFDKGNDACDCAKP